MIEDLIPIDLPPGLVNNGTTYQSKNRWFKGNLVRFFQGNKQPVGGWVKRTLTGATILGTPNAAVSWRLNDGNSYIAIGTTTNLYVVSSANVVTDITPPLSDVAPYQWQLTPYGSYLVAVNSVATYTARGNVWVWQGSVSAAASAPADPTTGFINTPFSFYGATATPERFLVLLRGSDPSSGKTAPKNRVN